MVVKYSRAQRRHDNARMYQRALRKVKEWEFDEEHLVWRARRIFNNMKNCSCWMCCNPRRAGFNHKETVTMQELKAEDSAKDSFEEYYSD